MNPLQPALSSPGRIKAFSLVEMLLVIGVIGLLIAISIPAVASMMKASNLNRAGGMVSDEFNFARQYAISRNSNVEVRFYRLGSSHDPGDLQYRALRTVLLADTDPANDQALTPLKFLPEPMIVNDASTYSSLLDFDNSARSGLKKSQESLPRIPGDVTYIGICFKPDGSTSLSPVTPPLGNWFLTIHAEEAASTSLTDNYFNVQLDPVTGRTRIHRP